MLSKRHLLFNIVLITLPWISTLFIDKRSFKRYSLAATSIVLLELVYQVIGQKRNWWIFYDRPKSFIL
ncbi:hypothetical protein [Aquibacillus sediminis]|uniref:hypothetical protein n=1 Tax=Aquibacillus sediminis TaxID=2574734 RepID=UPI00319E0975